MIDERLETSESKNEIKIGNREKVISLVVLGIVLITFWSMMDLVLLTFIISFIFYNLHLYLHKRVFQKLHFKVPEVVVLAVLYLIFITLAVLASIVLVPKIAAQFAELANIFFNIDVEAFKKELGPRLVSIVDRIDVNSYLEQAAALLGTMVTRIGQFGLTLFISMILSFIILLEKRKISHFGEKLATSKLAFMYDYFRYFGRSFANTFGKVMKVQVTIAFVNSILSMIMLALLGFPGILGLGTMIFVLGLIPVMGVTVSMIPLSAIAFGIGGIGKIFQVLVMILILHGIESYILNPKLMSDKTRLPICFVFIILLVGEHYLGVWGLLIGVPIFIFLMNVFNVEYKGE